jgi:peptidyl-prolyl cis-trans isomerase C
MMQLPSRAGDRKRRTVPTGSAVCAGFVLMAALSGIAGSAPPAGETAAAAAPAATVNGEAISEAELQIMLGLLLSNAPPTRRNDLDDAREIAREQLLRTHALAQQAEKNQLDQDPAVQAQLDFQRATLLARAYLREFLRKSPVTETQAKQEYQRLLVDDKLQEYHLMHILVGHKNRAVEVIDKLKQGESFAEVARLYSADVDVAKTGGDMGWINLVNLDNPGFVDAVLALQPGQYSKTPVRGKNAWHVLRLVEKPRAAESTLSFAELPQELRERLRQRAQQRILDGVEQEVFEKAVVSLDVNTIPEPMERAVAVNP